MFVKLQTTEIIILQKKKKKRKQWILPNVIENIFYFNQLYFKLFDFKIILLLKW